MNHTAEGQTGLPADPLARLSAAVDHAAHLLPAQGPIGVFIHHNTLHAFEHLPFDEAVRQAGRVFGCEPYLSEARYHRERATGRIRDDDLRVVLTDDLGDRGPVEIPPGVTRWALRFAMLTHLAWEGTADETRWELAVDQIPTRHPALWTQCVAAVNAVPEEVPPSPFARHRDEILAATGDDTDQPVNDLLGRYTAAYLDQGVSHHPQPNKASGFFRGFCDLYAGGWHVEPWRRELAALCRNVLSANTSAVESALESLTALGVSEAEWDDFLGATLLSLRGWGGMVRQVEERPDRVHHPLPPESFHGFVAVRLLLDRAATAAVRPTRERGANHLSAGGTGPSLARRANETPTQRAFALFQVARGVGVPEATPELLREVEAFPGVERRRLLHRAFERRLRERTLDALAHRTAHPLARPKPRIQLVTCLDEREESFRRHLEEVAPDVETFGAAGFFAVAMYYRGATQAHYTPLCPAVFLPKHWVREHAAEADEPTHDRLKKVRKAVGGAAHRFHLGTRTFAGGAFLAAAVGVLATIPLVARVLFPGLAAAVRRRAGTVVQAGGSTCLTLERTADAPGATADGHGFTLTEMVGIAERLLRDIGLTRDFCRLVVILGHGSHSLNNPHESAHDCGACGGSVGEPNARAVAQVLNDPRVRAGLAERGITIPADTWFVGGVHNTCNEYVKLADKGRVPASHHDLLHDAAEVIEKALDRHSHERCRRFDSAPLGISHAGARRHLDNRAEDLAQVRPEWGHATNAVCLVGRRAKSAGLFLDRRAFLVSYDPTQDTADTAVLARTLAAVFPVCGGINLEYYFSHVDSTGYGCGTKLPHNITALLGVMDGAASDLRSGLPWQMVEIHEAVRLLIVVEATAETLFRLMDANPTIGGMTRNGWVQVALQHPDTGALSVFDRGEFRPYTPGGGPLRTVGSSAEWYAGKRGYLEFVEVAAAAGGRA